MAKNKELNIIITNIKTYLIFFIILNILILTMFFYFYENTKNIKNEHIPIKLVTDDFPTVPDMLDNFKFYIEFVTDYTLDVQNRVFISSGNDPIDKEEITNYLDNYMSNYHNSINQLKDSIQIYEINDQTTSIEFYFETIKLFDRVYKLEDTYLFYKYKPINYLTILFSLIVFLNFFLYLLIITIRYLKKNK